MNLHRSRRPTKPPPASLPEPVEGATLKNTTRWSRIGGSACAVVGMIACVVWGGGVVHADGPVATPPLSVADAVAVAQALAQAGGAGGQSALAEQADRLAAMPAPCVIPCLATLADATPAGANWVRSGLERAADRLGDALPQDALAAVVADVAQPPRARTLAFAWLKQRNAARAEGMLDGMLDDPSLDLRREAVEKLLATGGGGAAEKDAYRRGLTAARDVDQLERIAGWLTEHGEPTDIAQVLGFVRNWQVSEAFDNAKGVGFAKAYPPEAEPVTVPTPPGWTSVRSADKHGAIDLNAAIATKKGVLAYAVAAVEMPRAGAAEVRIGSPCAVVVWVNGRQVMAHEIYHASEAIDQYVAPAEFRAGTNLVLVKCCQNEQTESWAGDWKFQLRICDSLGKPLATQPAAAPTQEATDAKTR